MRNPPSGANSTPTGKVNWPRRVPGVPNASTLAVPSGLTRTHYGFTDAGYFITTIDGNGVPHYERLTVITDLRESGTDPPITPPDEPDDKPSPPPTGISQDALSWANEVDDPTGAQRFALAIETVRDALKDEIVTASNAFSILHAAFDVAVGSKWDAVRRKLSDRFAEQMQSGIVYDRAAIMAELELIRYGIGYSAIDAPRLEPSEAIELVNKLRKIVTEGGE